MSTFPVLPQEQAQADERGILGHTLNTLGWLGESLSKPLAAVEGTISGLSGGPWGGGALNLIPFSDTMGITNPQERVSGRDLLERAGILDKNTEGLDAGDVAGFAADVALDPLTYATFGASALTKAGKAAKATGSIARGLKGAGELAAEVKLPEYIAGLEQGGNRFIKSAPTKAEAIQKFQEFLNQPNISDIMKRAGVDPLAASVVDEMVPGGAQAGKLAPTLESRMLAGQGGLMNIGLPFTEGTVLGTGPLAQKVGGALTGASDALMYGNPVGRKVGQLFQASKGNAETELAQRLKQVEYQGNIEDKGRILAERQKTLADAERMGILTPEGMQALRVGGEGLPPMPGYSPLEQTAHGFGVPLGEAQRALLPAEREAGIGVNELASDYGTEYFRRQHLEPRPTGFMERLKSMFGTRTDLAQPGRKEFFDVPGGTRGLESMFQDPVISGAGRTHQNTQAARDYILQTYFPGVAVTPELENQAKQLALYTARLPDKYAAEKVPFFNQNPIASTAGREIKGALGRNAAERNYEFLGQALERRAPEPGDLGLFGVLGRNKLTANDVDLAAGKFSGAKANLVDQLAQRGLTRTAEQVFQDKLASIASSGKALTPAQTEKALKAALHQELQGFVVPKQYAGDATRFMDSWRTPDEMRGVVGAVDVLTDLFKAANTRLWPAFHVRNLVDSLSQDVSQGAFSLGNLNKMKSLLHGGEASITLPSGQVLGRAELMPELMGRGVAMGHNAANLGIPAASASAQELAPLLATPAGATLWKDTVLPGLKNVGSAAKEIPSLNPMNAIRGIGGTFSAANEAGSKVGNFLEDMMRGSHFLTRLEQGYTPEAAAASMFNTHYNYGPNAMTQFEQKYMRRAVPFYGFGKSNLGYLANELTQKPGGMIGQTIKAGNELRKEAGAEGFVPDYLGGGLAAPIGKQENGNQRFLAQSGLRHEQLGDLFKLGPTVNETVRKTLSGIGGQLNPLIKAPIELMTGKQLYSGRDLQDLHGPTGNTLIDEGIMNSPFARAYTTGRTLFDPRKGTPALLTNLLTGAKVTDVDMEKAQSIAAQDTIAKLLKANPAVHAHTDVYVRKGDKGQLSPQELEQYRLYVTLQKEAQKAAKQKMMQSPPG